MRSILFAALALAITACGSSSITAPTDARVTGVYVLSTVNGQALPTFVNRVGLVKADTITLTPTRYFGEKTTVGYMDSGRNYDHTQSGSFTYNAETHTVTRALDGTLTEWHYDGRKTLSINGMVFIKILQGA